MEHTATQSVTQSNQQPALQLYWLRELGCDAGVRVSLDELEPAVRDRVAALMREAVRDESTWIVRLPFLDKREWRTRDEILRAMPMERLGNLIRCVLDPAQATRDAAATYALIDPAWKQAPLPNQAAYYDTWQPVSLALQKELKSVIARQYFSDITRFEDREIAYAVIAYQASRLFHGQSRTELTYDLRDYPECTTTLSQALRLTGRTTQIILAEVEQRLLEAGRPELSRRYAPLWYQDVLVAAKKRPRQLVELLAAETAVINAVIDLGTDRSVPNVNRTSRVINQTLRSVMGVDMRGLGSGILDTATRALADVAVDRGLNVAPVRSNQDRNPITAASKPTLVAVPARRPHGRVGS